MHVRAQPGTRIEETARLFDLIEQTVRSTVPPGQLDNIVDNIGLPFSGINMAYQNTGTIGPSVRQLERSPALKQSAEP